MLYMDNNLYNTKNCIIHIKSFFDEVGYTRMHSNVYKSSMDSIINLYNIIRWLVANVLAVYYACQIH